MAFLLAVEHLYSKGAINDLTDITDRQNLREHWVSINESSEKSEPESSSDNSTFYGLRNLLWGNSLRNRGHMMGTDSASFATVGDLLDWCKAAPNGTKLDARALVDLLSALSEGGADTPKSVLPQLVKVSAGWRELLWAVPAETRLGVRELAEALGRPRSWVYERTQSKAIDPIPHRKLDGILMFTAGEIRTWVRNREDIVVAGAMDSLMRDRARR